MGDAVMPLERVRTMIVDEHEATPWDAMIGLTSKYYGPGFILRYFGDAREMI